MVRTLPYNVTSDSDAQQQIFRAQYGMDTVYQDVKSLHVDIFP